MTYHKREKKKSSGEPSLVRTDQVTASPGDAKGLEGEGTRARRRPCRGRAFPSRHVVRSAGNPEAGGRAYGVVGVGGWAAGRMVTWGWAWGDVAVGVGEVGEGKGRGRESMSQQSAADAIRCPLGRWIRREGERVKDGRAYPDNGGWEVGRERLGMEDVMAYPLTSDLASGLS